MRAKQLELLRDLAKLLSKYSARDWEPIVRVLRAGKSKIPELVATLEAASAPKQKARSKTAVKKKVTAKVSIKVAKATKAKKNAKKPAQKRSAKIAKPSRELSIRSSTAPLPESADQHLEAWVKGTLASSTLSELHELYLRATGSKHLPPTRDAVIRTLIELLKRGSPVQKNMFLNLLQRPAYDETESYRRWTEMISRLKHTR